MSDPIVRVEYGLGVPQPRRWYYLVDLLETQTVKPPSLPVGTSFWYRSQTRQDGHSPSDWVYSGPSTIGPHVPALFDVRVVLDASGVPTAYWTPNAQAEGVRIEWSVQVQSATPTYASSDDVDATLGELELPETVQSGQRVSVRLTSYTGFSGGSVTGTPGVEMLTQADLTAEPGSAYGELKITAGVTAQGSIDTTPQKLTAWNGNGASSQMTPDHTTDDITVERDGAYKLVFDLIVTAPSANTTYFFEVYLDAVATGIIGAAIVDAGLPDPFAVQAHGFVAAAHGQKLALFVYVDSGSGISITPASGRLTATLED